MKISKVMINNYSIFSDAAPLNLSMKPTTL